MTDDLTARLERTLVAQERHEADAHPSPELLTDLHARIGRGRRRRSASHAAVAAAVAGLVGVAGWFGLQHRTTPEPAHTPAPTVTHAPTPAPSPTPSAQATAPPIEPVSLPGLPPMYRAPEGVLEQAGPGWFVAAYASGLYEPPSGDGERRSLVLSAPTGELYHLVDVTTHEARPVHWPRPDTVRALVWDAQGVASVGSVDLRTGDVTVDDRLPTGLKWVGTSGVDELWLGTTWDEGVDGTLYVIPPDGPVREVPVPLRDATPSPDGRTVVGAGPDQVPVAVDVVTGRRTTLTLPEGQSCVVTAWLDRTGLLASCVDVPADPSAVPWYYDEHGGQVVRLDAAGGTPRTLGGIGATGVVPWQGEHVRDGVVVATRAPLLSSSGDCYDFCYGGAYLWTGGSATVVPGPPDLVDDVCEVAAGGDGVLLRTGDLCYEETTGNQWWSVDEATGVTRLVAPAVDSDLGIGAFAVVERSRG